MSTDAPAPRSKYAAQEKWLSNPENKAKHRAHCREYMKAWRERNPEKRRVCNRKNALKRKYGITLEDVDNMHKAQKGLCKLCDKALGPKHQTAVDHCHTTKKVRGLLCCDCNTRIGHLERRGEEGLIRDLDYILQADEQKKAA